MSRLFWHSTGMSANNLICLSHVTAELSILLVKYMNKLYTNCKLGLKMLTGD